ncbi:MAG TPA: hypothetical protein VKS21_02560, partial [Spirochaetota bacterium]|nr:hypothetical protein [Spirochaetota bacterium]
IKKTVAAVLPGFKSVMIKGKGIEIYIQAPYSKTNQQKLTQYIIDRRQQTNADPGLFDRRGETEALAGKRYLLPAALKNHHRFRPGTEIIIEKKIPGSTIRIYGTLANWLIPGRYVKIKIKNSDKLIKEKIYKNKLFFN